MKRISIWTTVAVAIVLIITAGQFLGWFPWVQHSTSNNGEHDASLPTVPAESSATNGDKIAFEFDPTDLTGSGTSRTVTYELTNVGSIDAHNTWVETEVVCLEPSVDLGKEYKVRNDIGIITAGETLTIQVTFDFVVADGVKLLKHGAKFVLTVYSDEHKQILSYEYKS